MGAITVWSSNQIHDYILSLSTILSTIHVRDITQKEITLMTLMKPEK